MLRRPERTAAGESWLLVPQAEHAQLAGALAAHWGDAALAGLQPHSEVLAAISHHDDGWRDWDTIPDVDPMAGRPLSFVEMPLATTLDIWRRSIYLACSRGHLAAHMVSAHFTALLEKASPKWSLDPQRFQISRQFFDEQSEHRELWFAQWQRVDPKTRPRQMANLALAYLQFFDILSLWFCGAARSEPQAFPSPEGYDATIVPTGELCFTVRPWPLSVGRFQWPVKARRIPAARYASREALAATPSEPAELLFQLEAEV